MIFLQSSHLEKKLQLNKFLENVGNRYSSTSVIVNNQLKKEKYTKNQPIILIKVRKRN